MAGFYFVHHGPASRDEGEFLLLTLKLYNFLYIIIPIKNTLTDLH